MGDNMKKVAINASGGGDDTGASGNGIVEKDITLKISEIIADNLRDAGVDVLMMREGDETISYDDRIKRIKDKYGTSKDILVLSNTLNSGSSSGIEIIYPLKNNDTLPQSIENNLSYFNDTKFYQYRWPTDTTKDYYYITRNTPDYETIIVRYGYVDNSSDANIIKNDYEEMAEAVSDAILNYLGISSEGYYTVKSGDTLYSIAQKFGTTVNDLKQLNNLNTNNLSIGQVLKLPNSTSTDVPTTETYYEVVAGDTLYSIAKKFNTTVDKLKDINNLSSNNLSIGQLLKISSSTDTSGTNQTTTYKVVSGDTLYSIAKKFGISVDELKNMNNLTSNLISIGQELVVGTSNTYTVKKGDTLYSIAKKYDTTVDKLKDINNLQSDSLAIGKVLYVP